MLSIFIPFLTFSFSPKEKQLAISLQLSVVIIYSAISSSADTYLFTSASSVTQDFLERFGWLPKDKLALNMRIILIVLMVLGIAMALLLRDIVDTTFFFVSLTMSLGFLVLVLWIYPKMNKYSVNLSILFCLVGVIIPSIVVGISTSLVMYAIGLCIAGMIIGMIYNGI